MNSYIHYRDYIGNIEFSEEDEVFHDKVFGINSIVTFEGNSVQKPFKESFNVRIQPELHRKAAIKASARGLSLNAFVEDAIQQNLNQVDP